MADTAGALVATDGQATPICRKNMFHPQLVSLSERSGRARTTLETDIVGRIEAGS